MSTPPLKSKLSGKRAKSHKQRITSPAEQQGKKKIVIFALIAILAAIPFGLGKYFEFNSPGPYDSGAYVYSAKHILDGAKIGVDEKPSAQLGTLLVNILGVWLFGFNETGPKLIQTILQAAALLLMFIAMAKLFGTLPAAVGVVVASVYLSAPLIAKFGNVKEQYMIAFMVIGISCFVLHQLGGKWWYAILAGAFVSWAPLFKQTGMSAIGTIGLFLIVQPFFKNRSWKHTAADIGLLVAGAVLTIAPLYVWILASGGRTTLPYSFVWKPVAAVFQRPRESTDHKSAERRTDDSMAQQKDEKKSLLTKLLGGYVLESWQVLNPKQKKEVAFKVMRFYRLLILPIALAMGSIVARLIRMIMHRMGKLRPENKKDYDRFVLLFAVWWLLDMAFIWVSPRSYVQYYLPLNASAAMLGGYLIALYSDRFYTSAYKGKWVLIGTAGLVCMIIMSRYIFFGTQKSPHSGADYGQKRHGYLQKLDEVSQRRKKHFRGPWEVVGEYIRNHSVPDDKIYVWGWVPGIYVKAQRFSSVPKAFEGTMHTLSPKALSERIEEILSAFEKQPPKFIVDTHKRHFPWDRPPLELWPRTQKGPLPLNKQIIDAYDAEYSKMLRERIEPDEALRYEAMQPFREFVMKNYKIVRRPFGQHVLFERK